MSDAEPHDRERPAGPAPDLTRILQDVGRGRRDASEELLPLVYDQLKAIARKRMSAERPDHTLQATALVHEAYLRLAGDASIGWENRAHFFGAAARAMRRILIDHSRARGRVKRGGDGRERIPLNLVDMIFYADPDQVLAVDEAVDRLAARDARMAQIVQLRFYAGLSSQETADLLGVNERTVRREWALARAWLMRELDPE